MPRYFFGLRFGDERLTDEEGVTLSGPRSAREEAIGIVRDLLAPAQCNRRRWVGWSVIVGDERGHELGQFPVADTTLRGMQNWLRTSGLGGRKPGAPAASGPNFRQLKEQLRSVEARTRQLEEHGADLRNGLREQVAASQAAILRARELMARSSTPETPFELQPRATGRPVLVVVPGGRSG